MKLLSELRDPDTVATLFQEIRAITTRPWRIMEVCGGQTHAIVRNGLDTLLPHEITLVHGPGCPVCVTPPTTIDDAISLALEHRVTLCSYGDMLRVPGTVSDLLSARAKGGDVHIVYSPLDAVSLAQQKPQRQVVMFGVGFETTAPAHAIAVLQAHHHGLTNLSFLLSHVRVPPILATLLNDPDVAIDGILAAGHVCTIMGIEEYYPLVAQYHRPIVITGFEPVDVLRGIRTCIQLLEAGKAEVANCYSRVVAPEGNAAAREYLNRTFSLHAQEWRGLGTIAESGYLLRDELAEFDARRRFSLCHHSSKAASNPLERGIMRCRSSEVLTGRLKPDQCPEFGTTCTPSSPLGATMVSSEGACAAYYHYRPSRSDKKILT